MSTDRSKFKATSVATMQQQEKAVSKMVRQNDSERTEYLHLDEGTNKVRIFPAHPDSKSFIYPYGRWWLPKEVSYEKNGETITEIKKRPIYNARVHGGAQKDIVEEYVKFTTKILSDEIADEASLKEEIEKLTHWKTGLKLKPEWVVYCQKIVNGQKQFGLMTFSNGVKNKLNELAITDDDSESPISTDPFTDVDEGKAVLITYKPKEKQAKDVYKATLEWKGNYALTDEELVMFEKLDSLEKLFTGVYTRKDFDLAVAGLKMFDADSRFNTFDHDEWIDTIEEMQKLWPEVDSNEPAEKETKQSSKVQEKSNGDDFDEMDRDSLKRYIKKNDLDVIVKSSMSDDDIRGLIRDEINNFEEEVEDEVETETTSETEETAAHEVEKSEKKLSGKEKLAAAQAALKLKK
jgi:uncharacterized protein YeeX (DUF496 family)